MDANYRFKTIKKQGLSHKVTDKSPAFSLIRWGYYDPSESIIINQKGI